MEDHSACMHGWLTNDRLDPAEFDQTRVREAVAAKGRWGESGTLSG